MKKECPYQLTANAERCPLSITTYHPANADMDHLKSFFTDFVERDLWDLTNVSVGQIVRLLEEPSVQNSTFCEKCNAVTDLFVEGLLEKRSEMLNTEQ
jgi:hypothetical protein